MSGSAVVVGAGVVGTCSAYYLARAGWKVTLIDRAGFASGCSHGNCGYICPSHVLPLAAPGAIQSTLMTLFQRNSALKVRVWEILSKSRWFLEFARRCNTADMLDAGRGIQAILNSSRRLYEELVREEQLDCEWDPCGLLFVYNTPRAFDHYAEVNELLRSKFQMPAVRWTADELLQRETALKPGSVSGAYLYESDVQIRPDRLMASLRRVIEKLGVTIFENCEFQKFERSGPEIRSVITSSGKIQADAVVIATGAMTPLLQRELGVAIPILPGKGYSLTMPRPAICPRIPMIFEEHRVAISPFQSGFRIGSTMEFAGYDTQMNRKRLEILTSGAAFYLKEPIVEPIQEEWWGWRPMVYDGKPIIDRVPGSPNVLIAAGHGMLGLSMATGTGKLVAELMQNGPTHVDPNEYSLKRFQRRFF